jgi:DNA repair protein RadC
LSPRKKQIPLKQPSLPNGTAYEIGEVKDSLPNIIHTKYPNACHRERLRLRFNVHGLENLKDYEALELLLLYVACQKDMKPLAKRLIEHFGSFQTVLDASQEELMAIEGVGESGATLIKFINEATARYLKQTSQIKITPQNVSELVNYCRLTRSH